MKINQRLKDILLITVFTVTMSMVGFGIYVQNVELPTGIYNTDMNYRQIQYCWMAYYDENGYGQVYPIYNVLVVGSGLPLPMYMCDIIRDKCISYNGNTNPLNGTISSSIPCIWLNDTRTCQCEPYLMNNQTRFHNYE